MLTNDYGTDNTNNDSNRLSNRLEHQDRRDDEFIMESLLSARSELVMMLFDTKKRRESHAYALDPLEIEEAEEFTVLAKAALTRIDRALIDLRKNKVTIPK